ncbi:MAG TPA: PLDc N-terminal domain-containing protein [Thermoleophilaceae bacterium]
MSTAVWIFILIPVIVVWVLGIADIIRRPLSGAATAGWLALVIILPIIGTIIYFLTRKPTEQEILEAQEAAADQRRDRPTGLNL